MTMKLEDSIDVKVFILYLLNNVGMPLEFNTINDIVLQDEFVRYFDFAICFSELLENGQIIEYREGDEILYVISDSGKETLESYEGTLFPIIKERALRSALRLISYKLNGDRITSSIKEVESGGYMLNCEIVDNQKTLFSVNVHLNDLQYAEKLKTNFDERAEIIYRGSLSLLSGDVNFIFDE